MYYIENLRIFVLINCNIMKGNLSPVIVFAYNRLEHLCQTIAALQKNELAMESTVYIFCDGPKENSTPEQISQVHSVQEYADSVKEFGKVIVEKAKVNKGLANSVIYGVTKVIKEYGKAIIVEDDILTHPYFLRFMNQALDFYTEEKNIFTIGAFTENIKIPDDYAYDVFVVPRVESWGWATWADRWLSAQWDISTYPALRNKDRADIMRLCKGGDDFWPMLQNQALGKVDSWAVRWQYNMSRAGKLCLRPSYTLVRNIGLDGTGVHCDASESGMASSIPYYNKDKYDITLVKDIQENIIISNNLREYFACPPRPPFLERKRRQWRHIIKKISAIIQKH